MSYYKAREVFKKYQNSDFGFPKNHALNHFRDAIIRKGCIATTYTQHSERKHKSTKTKYRQGNKKPGFERSIVDVDTAMSVMSSKRKLRLKVAERIIKGMRSGSLKDQGEGSYTLMGMVQRRMIDLPSIYDTGNGPIASKCRQYNSRKIVWKSNGIIIFSYLQTGSWREFTHISRYMGINGASRNDCLLVHDPILRLKLQVVSLIAPLISVVIGSGEIQYALVRCYKWVFTTSDFVFRLYGTNTVISYCALNLSLMQPG
jgi:hypothetical protein